MRLGSSVEMNAGPGDSDMSLVAEFVSGRAAAFDRLYERHSAQVYNTCLGILGNPEDARDAMQDTFVQLYRSLPGFKGKSRFSTWVYRIAVNKCMDLIRGRPRWESSDSLEWVGDAERPVGNLLLEESVRRALLELKPDYRMVLVLCYFRQLSYAEIAECVGCSIEQVRVRLHRARKAFRKVYDEGDRNEV